jgi:PAS domain-containing protein
MYRFILQSNIERHVELLALESEAAAKDALRRQLAAWRRDLALLEADRLGATAEPFSRGSWSRFQQLYERAEIPTVLIHPGAGLHMVDMNGAFATVTNIDRRATAGERLFDVFPDNPNDPFADGVNNQYRSLRIVSESHRPHALAIQRYDMRVGDEWVERYWRPVNLPIFDEQGRLRYILHQARDVTADVLMRRDSTAISV